MGKEPKGLGEDQRRREGRKRQAEFFSHLFSEENQPKYFQFLTCSWKPIFVNKNLEKIQKVAIYQE